MRGAIRSTSGARVVLSQLPPCDGASGATRCSIQAGEGTLLVWGAKGERVAIAQPGGGAQLGLRRACPRAFVASGLVRVACQINLATHDEHEHASTASASATASATASASASATASDTASASASASASAGAGAVAIAVGSSAATASNRQRVGRGQERQPSRERDDVKRAV